MPFAASYAVQPLVIVVTRTWLPCAETSLSCHIHRDDETKRPLLNISEAVFDYVITRALSLQRMF
jgi:hypothetical protein